MNRLDFDSRLHLWQRGNREFKVVFNREFGLNKRAVIVVLIHVRRRRLRKLQTSQALKNVSLGLL